MGFPEFNPQEVDKASEDKFLLFLCTAGQELSSFRDRDHLVEKIIDMSRHILKAQLGLFILDINGGKEIYFEGEAGKLTKIKSAEVDLIEIYPENVVLNEKIDSVEWLKPIRSIISKEIKGVVSSPIIWENELLGQLVVLNKSKKEETFDDKDADLLKILTSQSGVAIKNVHSMESLQNFFIHMIEVMVMAVESVSSMPEGHCGNVARVATAMARALDLVEKDYETIYYASLIHDIGKIKVQNLSTSQGEKIHPILGAEMLYPVYMLARVTPLIAMHHEFYDGSGFPKGLSGKQLSISSQIIALAENFQEWQEDVMTKKVDLNVEDYIFQVKGKFSPEILEAFSKIKDKFRVKRKSVYI